MTKIRRLIDAVRNRPPTTRRELYHWVGRFTGIWIATRAICRGHCAPFDMFAHQVLERPSLALWHGPRGSGKSFLSAIDTHLASRFQPRHETRILGGSRAQSEQIYRALQASIIEGAGNLGSDRDTINRLLKTEAVYRNGSRVSILAASPTSVRGPHVASLKLDEVDEIDPEIRESAMGMAMELRGCRASVLMTSTWHRLGGPMSTLLQRGQDGEFPVFSYCIFEVLERCPDSRSGVNLEYCPLCPLVSWCHEDRDSDPQSRPKAKRSRGHYAIDALIQKVRGFRRGSSPAITFAKAPVRRASGSPSSTSAITVVQRPNLTQRFLYTSRWTVAFSPERSSFRFEGRRDRVAAPFTNM